MGLQCVRNGSGGPHPGAWPDPVAKTCGSPQVSVVWAHRDSVREYPPMFVVAPAMRGCESGRAWVRIRPVHHDAAIHVTPTMGAPAPSPARFLRTRPNQTSRTSASFDPQFPGRVTMQRDGPRRGHKVRGLQDAGSPAPFATGAGLPCAHRRRRRADSRARRGASEPPEWVHRPA